METLLVTVPPITKLQMEFILNEMKIIPVENQDPRIEMTVSDVIVACVGSMFCKLTNAPEEVTNAMAEAAAIQMREMHTPDAFDDA